MRLAVRSSYFSARDAVVEFYDSAETLRDRSVFISLKKRERALAEAESLEGSDFSAKPLYGMLFAVKDNIDVVGMQTTAGCSAFAYDAQRSAAVVERLEAAGAILVGKTNMDQFATGLVGVRSPFGIPQNALRADLIPGGSSSGSAVAVARGFVDFALGTDTAGAGRVPAGMNGIVGLKPTLGLLPSTGVVPACRTLETVSVFARDVDFAFQVMNVCSGFDAKDPFSKRLPQPSIGSVPPRPRIGVPLVAQRQFFGDEASDRAYAADLESLEALGADIVEIDFEPFHAAARLLYEGPWLAERYVAIKALIEEHPSALLPVTFSIINEARNLGAIEAFEAFYQRAELKRHAELVLETLDCLAVPTIPRFYTMSDIAREPVTYNSNLGVYTNFVNLLDLAAITVPVGVRSDNLPSSLTFIGPAGSDGLLAAMARMAASHARPVNPPRAVEGRIELVVIGPLLSGLPRNAELKGMGASFLRSTRTRPDYRLFAMPGTVPPRPGLLPVARGQGVGVEAEVWSLEPAAFGAMCANLAKPCTIGTVALADGTEVKGCLVDAAAVETAIDVSDYGSWRAFLAARK